MTIMSRPIPVTDDRGKLVLYGDQAREPHPGSVVLIEGQHGTAYQRFFKDGLWYRAGGGSAKTWAELLTRRNLVLVYDAPERQR